MRTSLCGGGLPLEIPGAILDRPRLNADGSYLYFLRGEQSGDVWIVRFGHAEGGSR